MSLGERIENDCKAALKKQDKIKVSTLRMLKSDMNTTRLDQKKSALDEGDILKIIQRHVKQHRDSIEQFEKGKRQDLAEKEKKELEILLGYMPEQLSEEELKKIITETISELGVTSKKEMGKVMKAVMEKAKGKADGKTVSQIVSSMLLAK
ncbi:MAG: GatB/YqeY domain-containing protein [Candidatus Omnitrophica bacterium]|nr:GatB/YqeY domain-containing protein [Candidatus Omnitrophota bacterium]